MVIEETRKESYVKVKQCVGENEAALQVEERASHTVEPATGNTASACSIPSRTICLDITG